MMSQVLDTQTYYISPATEEVRAFTYLQAVKIWRQGRPGNEASETLQGEEIKLWQIRKSSIPLFVCVVCRVIMNYLALPFSKVNTI